MERVTEGCGRLGGEMTHCSGVIVGLGLHQLQDEYSVRQ